MTKSTVRPSILLVDDDPDFTQDLLFHLGDRFEWHTRSTGDQVIEIIKESLPDVVLLDIDLGSDTSGLDILAQIRSDIPRTPVIMVTRHDPSEMAVHAWRLGAFGYIEKSTRIDQLAAHIERAIEEAALFRENQALREQVAQQSGQLVGRSPAMTDLKNQIGRLAQASSTVLITGETGTGKELVAREVHDQSPRNQRLFIPVCCPAIPETLVESELFGHEKGAFTGALARSIGKFELANNGTIFLDEIAEISLSIQAKLLRVLQDHKVQRIGNASWIDVDVRVIAATNRNLEEMVAKGTFREDLYYRLKVIPIHIPPLRERREDIPLIAQALIDHISREMNKGRCRLSSAALNRLIAWDWPGNVRELENVLENALVHAQSDVLDEELFAANIGPRMSKLTYADARKSVIERFEKDYVRIILNESEWNRSEAARRMGMTRQGLQKLMKRTGIQEDNE